MHKDGFLNGSSSHGWGLCSTACTAGWFIRLRAGLGVNRRSGLVNRRSGLVNRRSGLVNRRGGLGRVACELDAVGGAACWRGTYGGG